MLECAKRTSKEAAEFLSSIKSTGIVINRESDLLERLDEAYDWKYAFTTLAANGKVIGIRFSLCGDINPVKSIMEKFGFSGKQEQVFEESIKAA